MKNLKMNIFFYFPLGTLHCGKNEAPIISVQLGYFNNLDSCCRQHDACPISIAPNTYREMQINEETGELRRYMNHGFFTISWCQCDEKFMKCLNDIGIAGRLLYNFYREVMLAECIIYESKYILRRGVMPILDPIEINIQNKRVLMENVSINTQLFIGKTNGSSIVTSSSIP